MNFLLELPIWLGLLIIIIVVSMTGLFVVIQLKKKIGRLITKKHEKIGRILFRVLAGLIALLISLSYANERLEQHKIIDSMELETSLLVSTGINLNMLDSNESKLISQKLKHYVIATIDDDWEHVESNPFFSKTTEYITEAKKLAYKLPVKDQNEERIKNDIIVNLSQIITYMQVRIYSQHTLTPYLIYILLLGLLFMWVFFTVYDQDIISLSFLSLYNIFIAILIYFIFMLSNPLIGPLKIDTHSFMILKEKGIDYNINDLKKLK